MLECHSNYRSLHKLKQSFLYASNKVRDPICVMWLLCHFGSHVVSTIGKLSTRNNAWAWFRDVLTYGVKVLEFPSFYGLLWI